MTPARNQGVNPTALAQGLNEQTRGHHMLRRSSTELVTVTMMHNGTPVRVTQVRDPEEDGLDPEEEGVDQRGGASVQGYCNECTHCCSNCWSSIDIWLCER